MRDEDDRAAVVREKRLEPHHRLDVEMVRRLVEQQQIGLRDERAREQHAAPPSAGQRSTRSRRPEDPSRRDHHVDADVDVPVFDMREVFESVGHDVAHRTIRRERHVLFEPRDAQAGLAPHRARVGNDFAADDLQQRRFARAVAADDAHALARLDQQARVVEQRQMAVGHPDVIERDERHG